MDEKTKIERLRAQLAENRGYLRGRVESLRDELLADDELREALRARAWLRAGKPPTMRDGRPAGHPDGWPEGVDGDAVVAEVVDERLAPLLEESGAATPTETVPESVRKFREGLK